jgi:hypothetical protein
MPAAQRGRGSDRVRGVFSVAWRNPLRVLDLVPVWPRVLEAATWIAGHGRRGLALRQIDAPAWTRSSSSSTAGVLADLIDVLLSDAASGDGPRTDLATRYGYVKGQ